MGNFKNHKHFWSSDKDLGRRCGLMKLNESKIFQNSVQGVLDDDVINDYQTKALNKWFIGRHTRQGRRDSAKKTFWNTVRLVCLHGFCCCFPVYRGRVEELLSHGPQGLRSFPFQKPVCHPPDERGHQCLELNCRAQCWESNSLSYHPANLGTGLLGQKTFSHLGEHLIF